MLIFPSLMKFVQEVGLGLHEEVLSATIKCVCTTCKPTSLGILPNPRAFFFSHPERFRLLI